MDEVLQRKSNLSSSEKCLKIRKTLIKDIKHIYHHGKDDGDQADIDGECVLA